MRHYYLPLIRFHSLQCMHDLLWLRLLWSHSKWSPRTALKSSLSLSILFLVHSTSRGPHTLSAIISLSWTSLLTVVRSWRQREGNYFSWWVSCARVSIFHNLVMNAKSSTTFGQFLNTTIITTTTLQALSCEVMMMMKRRRSSPNRKKWTLCW